MFHLSNVNSTIIYGYAIIFLTYSPTEGHEGHLGLLKFLAIIKKAAINIHMQIFALTYIFICLGTYQGAG